METVKLPSNPKELAGKVVKMLPQKRVQDIVTKRFGLGGKKYTLEAIGQTHGITRERVRQIEEAALKNLRQSGVRELVRPFAAVVADELRRQGGVVEEKRFFRSFADEKLFPHLSFLLMIDGSIHRASEDDLHADRMAHSEDQLKRSEAVLASFTKKVEARGKPLKEGDLYDMFQKTVQEETGNVKDKQSLASELSISKLIDKNPYGEFGLVSWPHISPRGVRDKAYLVLDRAGKPLHFRDVADHINKAGWSKKRAHPQTVHNELIKDPRFILVGRGLYGLKDWGYEAGTVKDVLTSVLKKAEKPLTKEEIVKRVMERRLVKENTILLNLQDKKRFRRSDGGYALV